MVKFAVIIIIFTSILVFRTRVHAYVIALSTEYDGNIVIENEKNVVSFLEDVIQNSGDYSIKAFDRKAISYRIKKTADTTHSFYVIYMPDGTYHTLSFSATAKRTTSTGAWAMDTESDIASYIDYLNENNKWEVREIITNNGIDTLSTVKNILERTQRDITYYFRSSLNKNDNYDNCNTALLGTLVENKQYIEAEPGIAYRSGFKS
jgi:hypothetical protein